MNLLWVFMLDLIYRVSLDLDQTCLGSEVDYSFDETLKSN